MLHQSRQYTARGAKRGADERRRQRELVEAAGGWYAYLKGERLKREAEAQTASAKAGAEDKAEN